MNKAHTLAVALGLVGGYALALRPRLVRWGATDEEVGCPYSGADRIPGATRSATMSVTYDAPAIAAEAVAGQMGVDTRRLVQLGPSRQLVTG